MRPPTSPQQEHPNPSIHRNLQKESDPPVGVSTMWLQILVVAPLHFGYKMVIAASRLPTSVLYSFSPRIFSVTSSKTSVRSPCLPQRNPLCSQKQQAASQNPQSSFDKWALSPKLPEKKATSPLSSSRYLELLPILCLNDLLISNAN